MTKDVINVDGEDVLVREDTAKAFHGVHWAVTVIIICLAIMLFVTVGLFYSAYRNGGIESPAQASNSNTR